MKPIFTLPPVGEALISPLQFAAALGESHTLLIERERRDPRFPKPVERGNRRTRWKLSDARAYIAGLEAPPG